MRTSRLVDRVTSLERLGMRVHSDFQEESVAYVKNAGYTGVFVNGGSGMGADMMTPESIVESKVLPDLMPFTVQDNQREMDRRCRLLKGAGLKPWLCMFGIAGADESSGSLLSPSNRVLNRRTKLEMHAKLHRTPDIFGKRDPKGINWRGSRPLCISHPIIQDFYRDLFTLIPRRYEDLEGVVFLGGDAGPETCHQHTCPRCNATGLNPWERLINCVNDIYDALQEVRPEIKFYFTIWNQVPPHGVKNIETFLSSLRSGIGICMSISDNIQQFRKSGSMTFTQPWSILSGASDLFLETANKAKVQGRSVMVLGELSQSEVWDPVCHNFPLPIKILEFLKNAESIENVDALFDFWGNRGPFLPHANHSALKQYVRAPYQDSETLLLQVAMDHYSIKSGDNDLLQQVIGCWHALDAMVDEWALTGWAQRFSFAVGRDGARGRLYQALVPPFLKRALDRDRWEIRDSILQNGKVSAKRFANLQNQDRASFLKVASLFDCLSHEFARRESLQAAYLASREAATIKLAAELIGSIGRTVSAVDAYHHDRWSELYTIIEEEISARERALQITGQLGAGAGVNSLLVQEDIQNMRLFLSSDEFPHTPDEFFEFTECPYVA